METTQTEKMETTQTEKTPINSIFTLLQNQRAGSCQDELSQKLAELTTSVRNLGRKGKLTLEITVAPLSRGGGMAVTITDKIRLSAPVQEPETSIFFVGDNGELSRNDPRQRELPGLREVPKAPEAQSAPEPAAVAS